MNTKTGLPLIDQEEKASNGKKALCGVVMMLLIFTGVGVGIAYLIMMFGSTDLYNARIEIAKQYELKWAYISVVIFGLAVCWLNLYPVQYKEAVMRGGNLRANMFIYRLAAENPDESSAVVLHEDGDLGLYNRGNRSIYHFLENCLPIVVTLPLGFFTFPFPTFVCVCIYSFGRIIYQIGYTLKGFGGHIPGFLSDRGSTFTMIGLMILAAIKQF